MNTFDIMVQHSLKVLIIVESETDHAIKDI